MNEKEFKQLLSKLDNHIESLSSHPGSSHSTESSGSVGVISENMDFSGMNNNQLILAHTMLHMFYNNKNGKNLPVKSIEKLHKEVSQKLKVHSNFDRLDL